METGCSQRCTMKGQEAVDIKAATWKTGYKGKHFHLKGIQILKPREVVESLSLDILKAQFDMALSIRSS